MWKLVHEAKKGHRFFKEFATGRIAVADESGETPDETDDGVLYLDNTRPIYPTELGSYAIPVVDTYGARVTTVGNEAEVEYLIAKHGFGFQIGKILLKEQGTPTDVDLDMPTYLEMASIALQVHMETLRDQLDLNENELDRLYSNLCQYMGE